MLPPPVGLPGHPQGTVRPVSWTMAFINPWYPIVSTRTPVGMTGAGFAPVRSLPVYPARLWVWSFRRGRGLPCRIRVRCRQCTPSGLNVVHGSISKGKPLEWQGNAHGTAGRIGSFRMRPSPRTRPIGGLRSPMGGTTSGTQARSHSCTPGVHPANRRGVGCPGPAGRRPPASQAPRMASAEVRLSPGASSIHPERTGGHVVFDGECTRVVGGNAS